MDSRDPPSCLTASTKPTMLSMGMARPGSLSAKPCVRRAVVAQPPGFPMQRLFTVEVLILRMVMGAAPKG